MPTPEPPDNAGCGLAFEKVREYVYAKDLLREFISYHADDALNYSASPYLKDERFWIIPLYRRFYILISPNVDSSFGPHVAQLRYVSEAWQISFWLATLQVFGLAADTEKLWQQIQTANCATPSSWFMADKSGQVILER